MVIDHKKCTREEFFAYIQAHPRELTRVVDPSYTPPIVHYNDPALDPDGHHTVAYHSYRDDDAKVESAFHIPSHPLPEPPK